LRLNPCSFISRVTCAPTGSAPAVIFSSPSGAHVTRLMKEQGLSRNDALKQAARARGVSKKEAYRQMLEEKNRDEDESVG
jgi:hypothetical protein